MQTNILCQSCSMPIESEQLFGTERSGEKSSDYCRYCYEAGEFKEPNLSLEEMIAICIPHIEAGGMKAKEAEAILRETLPFLKRWRKQEEEPILPQIVTRAAFHMIGVSVRTTNAKEKTSKGKIPRLWSEYSKQDIAQKIPFLVEPQLTIGLYSDYESDVNGEYSMTIGKQVEKIGLVPEGMTAKTVPASTYAVFTTPKGLITEVVPKTWLTIWEYFRTADQERTYTGDYELYDEERDQVEIYIAVKA